MPSLSARLLDLCCFHHSVHLLTIHFRFFIAIYILWWILLGSLGCRIDVNDHFSIQQVDADQANEEKRFFMEQLNQIGVGLIDAQIAPPLPENLLDGANNPLNKLVNSDLLAEERKCWIYQCWCDRPYWCLFVGVQLIFKSWIKVIIEGLSIGDSLILYAIVSYSIRLLIYY